MPRVSWGPLFPHCQRLQWSVKVQPFSGVLVPYSGPRNPCSGQEPWSISYHPLVASSRSQLWLLKQEGIDWERSMWREVVRPRLGRTVTKAIQESRDPSGRHPCWTGSHSRFQCHILDVPFQGDSIPTGLAWGLCWPLSDNPSKTAHCGKRKPECS